MRAHHDDFSSRSGRPARLKRRADFLRVGKGRRWQGTAMTIQTEMRSVDVGVVEEDAARVGFTLTKRVGNAVVRNRARRRLREAVRLAPDLSARAGHDYVIIGRIEALRMPFEALTRELVRGVIAVHERGKRRDAAASGALKGHASKATHATRPGRAAPERIKPEP